MKIDISAAARDYYGSPDPTPRGWPIDGLVLSPPAPECVLTWDSPGEVKGLRWVLPPAWRAIVRTSSVAEALARPREQVLPALERQAAALDAILGPELERALLGVGGNVAAAELRLTEGQRAGLAVREELGREHVRDPAAERLALELGATILYLEVRDASAEVTYGAIALVLDPDGRPVLHPSGRLVARSFVPAWVGTTERALGAQVVLEDLGRPPLLALAALACGAAEVREGRLELREEGGA